MLPALTMRQQMRLIRVSVAAVVAGSTLRSVLRSAMLRRAVLRGVMVPRVQASEVRLTEERVAVCAWPMGARPHLSVARGVAAVRRTLTPIVRRRPIIGYSVLYRTGKPPPAHVLLWPGDAPIRMRPCCGAAVLLLRAVRWVPATPVSAALEAPALVIKARVARLSRTLTMADVAIIRICAMHVHARRTATVVPARGHGLSAGVPRMP